MSQSRDYWVGVALTGLGAVVLSPDALLIRMLGADLWTAAFWRLLLMCAAISAFLLVFRGRKLRADVQAIGWALLPAALAMTVCNLGFLYALTHTTVADTLALIATAPVFAAFFGMAIGETPPFRTWLAAGAIAVGIWIILDASLDAGTWEGALAAGSVAVAVAIFFTLGRVRRGADFTATLALSAAISAVIAAAMADTLRPEPGDWPYLCLMGLVVSPVALTLIALGPRRLPAAEVSLLMLLETALGPLWVWLALGETPGRATLLGGGLILGALTAHGLAAWRNDRKRRAAVRLG